MEMPKAYNHKDTEDKIYKLWEEGGFFAPEAHQPLANNYGKKGKFVTCIAPPNITGELHMGHALELTLQDILVRMKRMQGFKTLWIPGIDHAGIAAQNVVEKQLKKEGLTRHDLGREKFEKRVEEWKEKYGDKILNQFKKLGISVDWSRTRYTRDEKYEKAVIEAFNRYKKEGWLYKGERVVNWCVRCGTGISDLEVKYAAEKGKLYFIKYGPFVLATVRPETKLGDTALADHPDDARYKEYIGKELEIDSVDNSIPADEQTKSKKMRIIVVADQSVDPEFGTGIIKVTPAHDITDFEIGQRHNLPTVKVINERGKMNDKAGIRYAGLKVAEARSKITEDLWALGLVEKIDDYEHNIARCDRCNSIVEPLPSEQWFLKVSELSKMAHEAIASGEVEFYPERWKDIALRWTENMRDWNISRQLWWGHKIPEDDEMDVLDTWFSSALWPFATLGWPDKNASDLKDYYPTDFITSDRGILFLWHIRMLFSGKFFMGKAPFKKIYIHPTVMNKDGSRMSKSLGTGIDPVGLIEKYGTDALRFGLAYQTTVLQDLKFGEDVMVMGKKFANKLWNIARYVLMGTPENFRFQVSDFKSGIKVGPNKAIVEKLEQTISAVTTNINCLNFGEAAHMIYDFVWHEFADKYIEETKDKNDPETREVLLYVLIGCLKTIHPFMPFVTEEIYSKLPIEGKSSLIVESWPE